MRLPSLQEDGRGGAIPFCPEQNEDIAPTTTMIANIDVLVNIFIIRLPECNCD